MVYLGVGLHRKRSHVAALDEQGNLVLIRADSTWQRGLEMVVEATVPELRGRWGTRRIAAADAPLRRR